MLFPQPPHQRRLSSDTPAAGAFALPVSVLQQEGYPPNEAIIKMDKDEGDEDEDEDDGEEEDESDAQENLGEESEEESMEGEHATRGRPRRGMDCMLFLEPAREPPMEPLHGARS